LCTILERTTSPKDNKAVCFWTRLNVSLILLSSAEAVRIRVKELRRLSENHMEKFAYNTAV
jgi:hypothetical protein